MNINAPGGALRCLLRPQLRHVPCFHWCERARVQAQGGAQLACYLGGYASIVRLKPAGPEKKRPNSERFPEIRQIR